MLKILSRSLIIREPAIETWAQEMNWGPGTNWGPGELNSSPPWKLYFNPWLQLFTVLHTTTLCAGSYLAYK